MMKADDRLHVADKSILRWLGGVSRYEYRMSDDFRRFRWSKRGKIGQSLLPTGTVLIPYSITTNHKCIFPY